MTFCTSYAHSRPFKSVTTAVLDALNGKTVFALQESGGFVVSGTTLASGAFGIRLAIQTSFRDFDTLVFAILDYGRSLTNFVETPGALE